MQGFTRNRKNWGIIGVILLLFGMVAEVWAGPPLGHGRRYNLRHHQGHHGQGFAGEGICPQGRVTVQAPDDIRNQTNPLEPSREVLYSGESLFQVDVQPARNFTCEETMKEISDGQLFWIIRNGSQGTGMPAFKDLKDREIWQIVHYLRQFPQPRRR